MRIEQLSSLFQREPLNWKDITVNALSNDTRTMSRGDVFVAIATDTNDGHDYLETARERGASGYVLSRLPDDPEPFINVFLTRDPVGLIGDGAGRLLQQLSGNRIAVTGSAGKTTTKELIALLMTAVGSVQASEGNYNNTIGLPLTVLNRLDYPVDTYVTEMGMSYPGEIQRLVEIVRPQVRLWLNVMPAHIGNFASIEALRDAKAEILSGRDSEDMVIYNGDDILVKSRVESEPGIRFSFGFSDEVDLQILEVRNMSLSEGVVRLRYQDEEVEIRHRLPGRHHACNIAAAALTARIMNVPLDAMPGLLSGFTPMGGRGRLLEIGNVRVYDDCYNANPDAMKQVLTLFHDVPAAGRKVAVLGDMLELGAVSRVRHREIGLFLNELKLDHVLFYGTDMHVACDAYSGSAQYAESNQDAVDQIADLVRDGDTILVKASRGLRGERIIQRIQEVFGS